MIRTVFAIAVAALTFACVSGASQAAPIAPLPSGVTSDHGNLTQVRYRHRHCWRGRWGHRALRLVRMPCVLTRRHSAGIRRQPLRCGFFDKTRQSGAALDDTRCGACVFAAKPSLVPGATSWTFLPIAAAAFRSKSSTPAGCSAHARKQAHERNLDDMLIADVDSHHYENECYDDFLPFIENDVLRQLVLSGRAKGRQTLDAEPGQLPGHGRPHHPLSAALVREDRSRQVARRRTRPALDGRDERRLCLPVSDHAARGRPASVDRDGDRAVLCL